MKRLPVLLLAAALFLPGSSASGQTTLSLHGGLNLTILDDDFRDSILVINRERVTGTNVGLAATFQLSPPDRTNSLALLLSGTYAPKGSAHGGSTKIVTRLNYLEFAALFDVRFPLRLGRLASHVSLGPTVGWLMSCEFEFQDAAGGIEKTSPCAEGEFQAMDYGLVVGGNLELGLTDKLGVTTGFQYNIGIGYIDDYEGGTLKNRSLALRGGLLYSIG